MAEESPENVLNPLAIYRMARTALNKRDAQSSASNSPPTINAASSPTLAPRQSYLPPQQTREVPSQASHEDQKQPQDISQFCNGSPAQGGYWLTPSNIREFPSLAFNDPVSVLDADLEGSWDPANVAVLNMLDGGIPPWMADHLNDGHSAVDPLLFPF